MLANHVHADYYNVLPFWKDVGKPYVKVMGRGGYLGNNPLSRFFDWMTSWAKRDVIRISHEAERLKKKGLSDEALEERLKNMRAQNDAVFAAFHEDMKERGYIVCMAPEGTRKKDGRTMDVKKGFYRLASLPDVMVHPFCMSYDSMATRTGKDLFFMRFGEPFSIGGMDVDAACDEVRSRLLKEHTITAAGLLSDRVLSFLGEQREPYVSRQDFADCLDRRVAALREMEGVYLDPTLLRYDGRRERAFHYYKNLLSAGYGEETRIEGTAKLDPAVVRSTPPVELFRFPLKKGGNRLRFQSNLLRRYADTRQDVARLLDFA